MLSGLLQANSDDSSAADFGARFSSPSASSRTGRNAEMETSAGCCGADVVVIGGGDDDDTTSLVWSLQSSSPGRRLLSVGPGLEALFGLQRSVSRAMT